MSDTPELKITVRSYDLDKFGAHHNAVTFYMGGKEAFTLHGLALDRETGDSVPIGDNDDTLRVVAWPGEASEKFDLPINGEHTLFEGDMKDGARHMLAAFDAVKFINAQNLHYDPFELIGTAQNSNSVAHTIIKAMELEFPEEAEQYWAPGHDRILLPSNFQSVFMMEKVPDSITAAGVGTADLQAISPQGVIERVKQDTMPERDNIFFDRDKPFSPYIPLGQTEPYAPKPAEVAPVPEQPVGAPAAHESHMRM